MARSVAERLVEIMIQAGIQDVYGVVGASDNPVVEAIRRADDKLSPQGRSANGGLRPQRIRASGAG